MPTMNDLWPGQRVLVWDVDKPEATARRGMVTHVSDTLTIVSGVSLGQMSLMESRADGARRVIQGTCHWARIKSDPAAPLLLELTLEEAAHLRDGVVGELLLDSVADKVDRLLETL